MAGSDVSESEFAAEENALRRQVGARIDGFADVPPALKLVTQGDAAPVARPAAGPAQAGFQGEHRYRLGLVDHGCAAQQRPILLYKDLLEGLLDLAQMPRSLADCGVKRSMIPTLAQEAAKQWTANYNPRQLTVDDFAGLYEAAFKQR